jgi:cell division protein ZapA (FtsZ GTPase activity inhibitor)
VTWWRITYTADGKQYRVSCSAGKRLEDTQSVDDIPILGEAGYVVPREGNDAALLVVGNYSDEARMRMLSEQIGKAYGANAVSDNQTDRLSAVITD